MSSSFNQEEKDWAVKMLAEYASNIDKCRSLFIMGMMDETEEYEFTRLGNVHTIIGGIRLYEKMQLDNKIKQFYTEEIED